MTFRPALRPGAPLLRRDASHLQIGTSPGVVIADRPGLFALLRLMDGARDVVRLESIARSSIPELDGGIAEVLVELRSLGVVFDASRWSGVRRRGLDAEARHAELNGHDPARLEARTTYRLAFHTDATSMPLIRTARGILADSGISDLDSPDPELLVIASCAEPSRVVFERPVLQGLDHLPLVMDEDRVRIGPLVRPGHTPCVGCHDLHRADWDRAWPALLTQLGLHTGALTPPALTAVTTHAAALELAAEVLAHVDGRAIRTLGRCLVIGPDHDDRATWPVAFHHGCACDLLNAA
jgi:hypothetical protein